ncbi:MAG: tRNA uridine-5-carboxymethylaminomethyl(34) synthesis GTPase MnmE [Mangrovibacterium sp.]
MSDPSTICAVATSPGMGPIAVIRLSGEKAIEITDEIFQSPAKSQRLARQKANTLHFGTLCEGPEIIDEVVISLFRAPHSFTGEDVVEISCHGSVYIQQRILQLLLSHGARMARPGEYTQRAFMNGKMDLSQAEAVADLIASTTRASQKVAMSQMRGGFSARLGELRKQLLHFIALVELELDFSEEDVEFADRKQLRELVDRIARVVNRLKDSYQLGNVIKNGIPVAIIGETNVGKSTLLNALLNEERAIVSDIHGTTRDVIEDVINIQGTAFRFFDTAGIRETVDAIESMGIERSFNKLREASIVLLVVDTGNPLSLITGRIEKIRRHINPQQHLVITANKVDIGSQKTICALRDMPLGKSERLVFLSAKNKMHLEELISVMQHAVALDQLSEEDTIVTNARHYEALCKASEALQRVQSGMDQLISGEFLAQDIRECLEYLGEITGQISNDEVLGHIFKHFCIGK